MGTWKTTIPAALSGLAAVLQAWPDLEGVPVYDGPVVSSDKSPEAVIVGFSGERMSRTGAYPELEAPAVDYQAAVTDLNLNSEQERYSIRSILAVRNGNKNGLIAARQRAYDLLGFCGAAVAANKKLGGAVAMASMGAHQMTPEQTPRGPQVEIVFTVDVEAWTGR